MGLGLGIYFGPGITRSLDLMGLSLDPCFSAKCLENALGAGGWLPSFKILNTNEFALSKIKMLEVIVHQTQLL